MIANLVALILAAGINAPPPVDFNPTHPAWSPYMECGLVYSEAHHQFERVCIVRVRQ